WLSVGGPGGERLCPPGRRRLPELCDHLAGGGVPDGLLPDPGPDAQGPRRGRRLAALAPPPRRVRQRLTRTEGGATSHRVDLRRGNPRTAQRMQDATARQAMTSPPTPAQVG